MPIHSPQHPTHTTAPWPWLTWALGWALMVSLSDRLDLANLAMVLLLTSAIASLWLSGVVSALVSTVAVVGFNWAFVPPRFELAVDLHQHALLLLAMLVVNWIISGLVIRQRRLTSAAQRMAEREARLRSWGDVLRDAPDPAAHASALHAALADAAQRPVAVMVLRGLDTAPEDPSTLQLGHINDEQRTGLGLCVRDGHAMGAGTGRYDELPDWYLPLRGRGVTLGASLVSDVGAHAAGSELRPHLQALCDQMGAALQRSLIATQEQLTREHAQQQATRNALLAAISHDYRTPLATIMSAASSLHDQAERLDVAQRRRLASGIVEEAAHLHRMTDNTLQLARLDSASVQLRREWESAEEIVGAALRRVRRRPEGSRIKAWVEPELPLLWCDALLMAQLLDNLLDNALKYSPPDTPVELKVRRVAQTMQWSVCDRGPGIAPAWRDRVFEVFQRGHGPSQTPDIGAHNTGTGVGLAVSRSIARAHGGELIVRVRAHGGSCFECTLPLHEPPHPAD